LEDARTKLPTAQEDVKSYQSQLELLNKRAEDAEAALAKTKQEFEKQKASWTEERQDRERSESADRRDWVEELPSQPFRSNSRPESPLFHQPARAWSNDFLGLGSVSSKMRKPSTPTTADELAERFSSRRPSAQPPSRPTVQSGNSGHPTPPSVFSPTVDGLPTPSMTHPLEQDDPFEAAERSSSPQQVTQDMVSVSTVAAGPSVQLVERMSAAIRRLESEKVAAREELARISNQRDEARAEIVALMRDTESGKAALKKVSELEGEVADVTARYETTLELLGEKSELVEELRADVQDVKAMYRDLVERTVT
jgi:TATA element modulatory factor